MTVKEVKIILSDIRGLQLEINSLQTTIDELNRMSRYLSPADRRGSARELYSRLSKRIEVLNKTVDDACNMIELVQDPLQRSILYAFYVENKTGEQIADEYAYSIKSIWRFLRAGQEDIAKQTTSHSCKIAI